MNLDYRVMANRLGYSMGFLTRLRNDQRGNVIAMIAAGMVPLLGLIGGGVDMSRIYLTKTRLQQACDAGALAGRKQMAGGAWSANSNKANETAERMFDANFAANSYGSGTRTRAFSEAAGKVSGTASVPLPMTVMKIFGQTSKTITVTCDAEMRIPNTDVMFVLDTTGSMLDCPDGSDCNGNANSKIVGLRNAVKCFYEALAKLDVSDADCGSTPTGGNSAGVQLRFGFVPYASNVNVGRLLNNNWMSGQRTYQSRQAYKYTPVTVNGVTYNETSSRSSSNRCNTWAKSDITSGVPNSTTAPATFVVTGVDFSWVSYNSNTNICTRQGIPYTTTYTQNANGTFTAFLYKPVSLDVSLLKAGGYTWNNSVSLPLGNTGGNVNVNWDGCIDEAQTWQNLDGDPSNDYNPTPASANDMKIDLIPSTSDATTQWGPLLYGAVWGRYDASGYSSYANIFTDVDLYRNVSYSCPTAARKLQTYASATDYRDYVNSLVADGSTYHDIGLVWGARLLSPTGLFASENAFTPQGGEIERHLIFMTDGATSTYEYNLTAHGATWWDRRQTNPASAPTNTILNTTVNARLQALCSDIKGRSITLWIISFGSGVSNAAQTALESCATPTRFYNASDSATLISNFQQIANEISQLRLTN